MKKDITKDPGEEQLLIKSRSNQSAWFKTMRNPQLQLGYIWLDNDDD